MGRAIVTVKENNEIINKALAEDLTGYKPVDNKSYINLLITSIENQSPWNM